MAEGSTPPLSKTFLAAAGGGFAGAVAGVVAATMLMGDGDGSNGQAANQATETPAAEVVVAER